MMLLYRTPEVDMKPLYIPKLKAQAYSIEDVPVNVFYKKVEPDHYYMIGDNRDNSEDSRFWGSVPYSLIIGKPWVIYFSLEYRSYERVLNGIGGGRDHQALRKVCGDKVALDSKECKDRWNHHRFSVRWDRVGRNIDNFQYEAPKDD